MMTKHTPGPWKQIEYGGWLYIGGDDIDYIQYDPVHEPYNYHVENAVCVIDHVDNITEQGFADARLVAAAPKLLAALEAVLPWAAKAVADHYNQKQGGKALDAAYDVIARVRGE